MTQPNAEPKSNRTLLVVIIVLLLLILCGGAVPTMGILAAIAIPNFVVYQQRAKRAEVPPYVNGIRVAQIAYHAAFDTYLEIPGAVPVDPLMVGSQLNDWPSGTGFDELGWMPDGQVRGTYWVVVLEDGSDFEVHGVCDVDSDGQQAHYVATREESGRMVSPLHAY